MFTAAAALRSLHRPTRWAALRIRTVKWVNMADVESDDPTRKRRFADIGDEDIDLLLKKKDSLSTKQATRTSVKVLRDFQEQLHSADGEADRVV